MSVLIITIKGDEHAIAVAAAIRRMNGHCDIWWTSDFPGAQHHEFRTGPDGLSAAVAQNVLPFDRYRSIWIRRLRIPRPNFEKVHPDDVKFVDQSLRHYHSALWQYLSHQSACTTSSIRWVNDPGSIEAAESKVLQLDLAPKVGFNVPKTLITNSRDGVIRFIEANSGGTIRKSFVPFWWQDGDDHLSNATNLIERSDLPSEEVVALYPEIYQEYINKVLEIRILFVEEDWFPVYFSPDNPSSAEIDWRSFHKNAKDLLVAYAIPGTIIEQCQDMMKRLNLATATFEFCVDKDGNVYFLEVNQAGQFLWLESIGHRVLDYFARFLLQATAGLPGRHLEDLSTVMASDEYKALVLESRARLSSKDGIFSHRSSPA
jgi:hypothetical protein